MLDYAMKLLRWQFEQCMNIVADSEYYKLYAEEKWRHSLQVYGAGNYLIKHIAWLKNKDKNYLELVKSAVLLHDVCRFTEIADKYRYNIARDHGADGAELLKHTPFFNDIRIWLPIKHHGHLIERLYEDNEYINIADEMIRQEVKLICFLIRDADKIANFNMMLNEPRMQSLFLGRAKRDSEVDGRVSKLIKDNAFVETTVPRSKEGTVADYVVGYISWLMDINYQAAIDFCNKLNLIKKLFALLDAKCYDADFKTSYVKFVRDYLVKHKFIC